MAERVSFAEAFAYGAAFLQAAAYGIYLRSTLRHQTDPNPTSWLMWAYGTALVLIVEWDQNASTLLLLLPIVCTACGIGVAASCWRKGTLRWPIYQTDRAAFTIDLGLTALYIGVVGASSLGWIAPSHDGWAKAAILLCVNLSTAVSYGPILRSTRADPAGETWPPWAIWTAAYTALWIATIAEEGVSWFALQFWIYPMICMVLNGLVGWHALAPRPDVRPCPLQSESRPPPPALRHSPEPLAGSLRVRVGLRPRPCRRRGD